MKTKIKIFSILLPILTVSVVFIYGYFKYLHSVVNTKQSGDFIKPSRDDVLSDLQVLEVKIKNNKSFISSSLGISIVNTNEIPQNINSGAKDADIANEYANLKLELTNKYKNDNIIQNLVDIVNKNNKGELKDSKVMFLVTEYITLNELKKQIDLNLPYDEQVNLINSLAINDIALLDIVNAIKKQSIANNLEIIGDYKKLANKIDYAIYIADNNPSFIRKILFQTKKYIGIKKEGEVDTRNRIDSLIKQENFKSVLNLLKQYNFLDKDIIDFINKIEHKDLIDDMIFDNNKKVIEKIAQLTQKI